MNNSQITLTEEPVEDTSPMFRARQEKIAQIIYAIDSICQSEHWKLLEKEVFKPELDSAVNLLCTESDDRKVASLQGEIKVRSKYADFKKLSDMYRMRLQEVKEKLKGRN